MKTEGKVKQEKGVRAALAHFGEAQAIARDKAGKADGLLRRLRLRVWAGWLGVLVWLASSSWKRLLGIAALLFAGVLVFLFRPIEQSPKYGLDHEFALGSEEFLPTITGATDTPFLPGNRIDILNNGDEFYPAMLDAVQKAERSITIEAFIYWAGDIGRRFAEALAAKARAGVPVKILLDSVGSSSISDDLLQILESGGCQVRWYHPVRWYTLDRANNRTHRKSLVIDGRVGFTGGAGIADHWTGRAQSPEHWRDINIRLEGPAVRPLQTGFARNWLETTGELLSGPAFYPVIEPAGPLAVQSILSSPETGSSTVRIMYYLSILCARRNIFIANPYFVPDAEAVRILIEAKRRGVDVKIMVAGEYNDSKLARANSVRLYGQLLAAGVEIYEYLPTMLHQKYLVADGVWSTIGTTNFDNRSFALNDENNVCVYDQGFAARFEQIFLKDLEQCRRITLDAWRARGLWQKTTELFSSFLRDQV